MSSTLSYDLSIQLEGKLITKNSKLREEQKFKTKNYRHLIV